jgi:tetratricopeptide (TPR) repeat protein
MIEAAFEWNWHKSEISFRRAIDLQPSLSLAHHFYAILCLQPQRRYSETVSCIARALLLNPFDAILGATATLVYVITGDYEAAVRHYELATEVSPRHPLAYVSMGIGYETQGHLKGAVSMFRKACELAGPAPVPLSCLAHALARSEERAEANDILQKLLGSPRPSGFALAVTYDGLGERTEALQWLRHAIEEREPQSIIAPVDPRLTELRASTGFQQLLAYMGLTPANPR